MSRVAGHSAQGCPSEDALSAFVAGDDPDGGVVAHLDACPPCRRIVSALAAAEYGADGDDAPVGVADTALAVPGEPEPSSDLAPPVIAGGRLGRFTVKRLLGHGGMGEVWAAHDALLDREVAVKLLRFRSEALGVSGAARLKREAQAMARLRHPNVVAIYDLGDAGGQLFCAMELVDGVTLRAWLEQPRPWREVFDVVLGIGRGIAAAHASGLIHRDIKPDNVLITRDGRPLVTDFGLAKLVGAAVDDDAADPADAAPSRATTISAETVRARLGPGPRPGPQPLTMTGMIIGTPAYMPLEQLEGRRVGPQSDQFSFCATAYEALFGVRPIVGNSVDALVAAAERGAAPPERSRGVPRAVIRCLLRGLSREPAHRFPSMDALLDALEVAAGRGRRVRAAMLGASGVVVAATVAAVAWSSRTDPQDSVRSAATSRMSEIWGDSQRAQLRDHFLAMRSPLAEDQLVAVTHYLDSYRTSWLAARVDAWAATRVRGEQSQQTLERRIACFERLASAMQATVRVLATVTPAEVEHARTVVAALPDVAQCADLARLEHEPALPNTPQGRALDAELHALEALHVIGRNDEALAKARSAVTAIERSSDHAQLPRAVFNLGWIEADLGQHADAETQLRRALELGAAARDHSLVARIWLRLFTVIGVEQRRPEAALALEPAVRAAVLQAGDDPLQRAELAKNQGLLELAKGNNLGALDHLRRSRELFAAARGPDDYDLALADINLASVELQLGKLDDAQARLERAIAAFDAAKGGARHPTVAQAHQNLCAVAWRKQDWAASERHCRAAVEIYVASLGPEHPATAKSRMYLGRALRKLGRLAEAQTEIELARAIRERTLPPDNPERIQTDVYVAQIAAERGHYLEAEALARKALSALREYAVPEHLHPFTLSELARFVAHRDPVEALDYYDEALRIHTAKPGRDTSGDAEALSDLATAALAADKPDRALVWFAKLPEAAAQLADVRKALETKAAHAHRRGR